MSSLATLRVLRARTACTPGRSFHSTPLRREHFLKANVETFTKAISNKDKVVLVDFYADWCNPCKMLSPILESVTSDPNVKSGSGLPLDLVTIDTDNEIELAQQYNIRSLPTVLAFKDGQPAHRFVGALPEAQVRAWLRAV
ncbi:thioredoxin [Wolfiporia cocos MD-104 SS10]|uniref:Thioredoxin n=1 Tax=Wolfiporia cocos (strain MD-104) TaxID=742152 RepID=A0A2H3J692_WOLCO|nr:thioredoxin [Wolfiporia cocos MD-104 SS10]